MPDSDTDLIETQLVLRDADRIPLDWTTAPDELLGLARQYYPDRLPPLTIGQARQIQAVLDRPALMTERTLPLVCVGEGDGNHSACPYSAQCPLVQARVPPLGQPCPFETRIVELWMAKYMEELNVGDHNLVEQSQVRDLVFVDLLMQRAIGILASDGLVDENPVGVIPAGRGTQATIYRKEASSTAILLERLMARKEKMLRALMATREVRARYKKSREEDPSNLLARLLRLRAAEAEVS